MIKLGIFSNPRITGQSRAELIQDRDCQVARLELSKRVYHKNAEGSPENQGR